ncbi:MAG: IS1595 family transposase [Actinomycetota bacterium]
MSARDRNSDKRSPSSESQMTYGEFLRMFPTNQACLDYLRDKFYPAGSECPSCHKATKFHHVKGRSAFACQYCRTQVYPTAGTIFHKSTTNLQLWFYAIFLMSSTRCGISAKQLEREIGVTYKTAHRMFKQVRSMLQDDDEPFSGEVEVDETYIGGRAKWARGGSKQARGERDKTVVFGAAQRGHNGSRGKIKATVVPHNDAASLIPQVRSKVLPSTMVFTDELRSYHGLEGLGYGHQRVSHSTKVWVNGDAHTNTIEGFWSLLKGGLGGVYHSVSTEYLQDYVNEYCWRYNHRDDDRPMFWTFLDRVTKSRPQLAL